MESNLNWEAIQNENIPGKTLNFLKSALRKYTELPTKPLLQLLTEIFTTFTQQIISLYNTNVHIVPKLIESFESLPSIHYLSATRLLFCEFYNTVGSFLRSTSKLNESIKFFRRGVELGARSKIIELVHCHLNLNLSAAISETDNHHEALKYARIALNLSQEIMLQAEIDDDRKEEIAEAVCISYHTIGVQEEFLRNLDYALEWYQKAHNFALKHLKSDEKQLKSTFSNALNELSAKLQNKPKMRLISPSRLPISSKVHRSSVRILPSLKLQTPSHKKKTSVKQESFKAYTVKVRKPPKSNSSKRSSKPSMHDDSMKSNQKHCEEVSFSPVFFDMAENAEVLNNINKHHKDEEVIQVKQSENTMKIQSEAINLANKVYDEEKKISDDREHTGSFKANESFGEVNYEEYHNNEDRSIEISKESFTSSNRTNTQQKVLIKSYSIDIRLKEYEINFFINSTLDVVYVLIEDYKKKYELEYKVDPRISIFDTINEKINPYLDIIDNELVIGTVSSKSLITGTYILNSSEILVSIELSHPRNDLIINFEVNSKKISKLVHLFNILKKYSVANIEKQFLFTCFYHESNQIIENHPIIYPLQLVYYRNHTLNNSLSCFIKISEVTYTNLSCFLIEALSQNDTTELQPLLISFPSLSSLLNLPSSSLIDNIELMISRISIISQRILIIKLDDKPITNPLINLTENHDSVNLDKFATILQSNYRGYLVRKNIYRDKVNLIRKFFNDTEYLVEVIDSPSTKTLKLTISDGYTSFSQLFNYPVPFKPPAHLSVADELLYYNGTLALRNPKTKKIIPLNQNQSSTYIESAVIPADLSSDFYDRIIYRTCTTFKEKMFQISIILTKSSNKEDILIFHIKNLTSSDLSHKFSIDLKTVCEKTRIDKNSLIPLCGFLVKNMLVLGEGDISYLDFSKGNLEKKNTIVKIQAVIRGVLVRKKIVILKKNILLKKRVIINSERWTCLILEDKIKAALVMVKGVEVLSATLSKGILGQEPSKVEYEKILKGLLSNVRIVVERGIRRLTGIERYGDDSKNSTYVRMLSLE